MRSVGNRSKHKVRDGGTHGTGNYTALLGTGNMALCLISPDHQSTKRGAVYDAPL